MVAREIAVKKYVVKLSADEREQLESLIHGGKHPAQKLTKARILLKVDASPAGEAWQGHSILITSDSAVCQDAVEIHGVAPEGVGNVVDLIEPQDVEGEAAQDGQDGRALAHPAGVLVRGDIQYVVDPVLCNCEEKSKRPPEEKRYRPSGKYF